MTAMCFDEAIRGYQLFAATNPAHSEQDWPPFFKAVKSGLSPLSPFLLSRLARS
jgi:hypothetical protein